MYHRLMLGRQPRTLDRYWIPELLNGLQQSIDDLPPASKAYLASKSPSLAVSEEDLHHAEEQVRRRLLQRRVADMVAAGRVGEALAVVVQSGDQSPAVADLRVQLLELTDQLVDALQLAQRHREGSARSGATSDFFRFNFHTARLAERIGDYLRAYECLAEGLAFAKGLEATEDRNVTVLRHIAALLSLRRRSGEPRDERLVNEAVELVDEVPIRRIRNTPGLLRDLAAEIGAASPNLLRAALLGVGISLKRTDPSASEEARIVAEAAAAIHPEPIDDPLNWAQREERGALGISVSESLEVGESLRTSYTPQELVEAVSNVFAQEADAAITYSPPVDEQA
jgi:hypothetical protein